MNATKQEFHFHGSYESKCDSCAIAESCTKCEHKLQTSLYCFDCCTIQKIKDLPDYYQLFGLDTSYRIDIDQVNEKFDELLVALHPDFYSMCDKAEQSLSLKYTAYLNEAKKNLFDPFLRGKYLLSLINGESKDNLPNPPQSFIFEVFEIQEAVDEIEAGAGNTQGVKKEIEEKYLELIEELNLIFDQLLISKTDQSLKEKAGVSLAKLNFFTNLKERFESIQKSRS